MSAWYKTGTIASAGNVVTGAGTKWADNKMGIGAGQMLIVPGDGIVQMYEILRIDSDTQLRLVNAPSAELSGAYAIVSFYTDSVPDFSRKLTAQLAYYQSQMDDWQQILTGEGQITIIAPDGTAVTMTALGDILQNIDWLKDNKDEIEAAGGYATEAKDARDEAVTAAESAGSSKDSATSSAKTATDAADSILGSVSAAQSAAQTATEKAAAASSDADRAEAAADSIDPTLLMPKSGGMFTGPVELFSDAAKPMEPVTKQQLSGFMPKTGGDFTGEISADGNIKAISGDLYSGDARLAHDGNIFGTVWVDSLFAYIGRKSPQSVILYPEGTQASPFIFPANTRKEYANPFPNRQLTVVAEILHNGIWGATGWIFNSVNQDAVGLLASQINGTGSIVVQSGRYGVISPSNYSGNPHQIIGTASVVSAPFRLVVSTKG